MKRYLAVCLLGLSMSHMAHAAVISPGERAELQAAMLGHIQRHSIQQSFLSVDPTTGEVRKLRAMDAHPLILLAGEQFILCTDFMNERGDHINIDFFLVRKAQGFIVFDTAVDRSDIVRSLMASGKARKLD